MFRRIVNFIKKRANKEELLDFEYYTFTDLFEKNIDEKVEVIHCETDQVFLKKLSTKLKDFGEASVFSSANFKDKVSVPVLDVSGQSYEKGDWYLFEADFGFVENSRLLISNFSINGLNFFDLPKNLVVVLKRTSILNTLNDCMKGIKDKYATNDFTVHSLSLSKVSPNLQRIVVFIKP
ncbi:hypothetical protein [Polaribacter sp.]|uniref:hypothetical protein n=1 Tax=Polaribacter sp. TaxID=1920175 RepID=UPI0025CED7BE|nr:hypothetical protein [Polaribacter sp.]